MTDRVQQVARAVEDLTKPLIAGVNGPAVGAGMDMALMCDYRIASDTARFSEGYIRVGLVPGDGGCFLSAPAHRPFEGIAPAVDRRIPHRQPEAFEWNIVDEVCDTTQFDARLEQFAALLAAQSPIAVQLIKTAVRQSDTGDLRSALDLIASHQAVAVSTADSIEAFEAFTERRPAVFHRR